MGCLSRKKKQECIIAEYATTPTAVLAEKYGMKETAVLIYANDYSINEISASTGIHRSTVQSILKRNGITPQPPKLKKAVIQWTLDGKIVTRHPSYGAAAKALGKQYAANNIQACAMGVAGHKSAYGYRWTIEKL